MTLKNYIIIGSNNFWYTQFKATTETFEKKLSLEVEEIKYGTQTKQYDHSNEPIYLRVFEANELKSIDLEDYLITYKPLYIKVNTQQN